MVKAESCCEPSTISVNQGLTEQGGVAQFEESPLAQRNIIKAETAWPDVKKTQRKFRGEVASLPSAQGLVC